MLLDKELDPDDAEMTRTRKVRRRYVSPEIRGYHRGLLPRATRSQGQDHHLYQDGRQAEIEYILPIQPVHEVDMAIARPTHM